MPWDHTHVLNFRKHECIQFQGRHQIITLHMHNEHVADDMVLKCTVQVGTDFCSDSCVCLCKSEGVKNNCTQM